MQGTTKDWESCAVKIAAGEHHIKKGPIASRMNTLPKTNIAPEKLPSQKESSLPTIHFQVLC